MDAAILQILLRRSRELDMTASQVRRTCKKRHCKRFDELSDEQAVELAGKMKVLLAKKKRVSVTMVQQEQINQTPLKDVEIYPPKEYPTNPITGKQIDLNDIDQLIEASLQVSQLLAELKSFDQLLRRQALDLADGIGKTRRLQGKSLSACVENCGGVYPNMEILKQAYESHPSFRDEFLRVDKVALKNFNNLASLETDDPAYEKYIALLRRAVEKGTPVLPILKRDGVLKETSAEIKA